MIPVPCDIDALLSRHPALKPIRGDLVDLVRRLTACLEAGGTLYLCGNGGSAADSDHVAGELLKGFRHPRPMSPAMLERLRRIGGPEWSAQGRVRLQEGLRAVALPGLTAAMTAAANDNGADMGFAQCLYALARAGDALWALSTSGNSGNVIRAAQVARAMGVITLGTTGADGGELADWCDVCVRIPARETFLIQEYTVPIYHAVCAELETYFFGAPELTGRSPDAM